MPVPDTTRTSGDDPVLTAGLAELASEGVNLSDPVSDAAVDTSTAGAPAKAETPATKLDTPPVTSGAPAASTDLAPAPVAGTEPPDPLAGTEPFTYTVNGETRTMPNAYRVPGEGVLIEEAAVPQFQLMASRAESLERANRELYERTQQFERLSSWTVTDAQGQSKTLTGREALEASRVSAAQSQAVLETLTRAIDDPSIFASLVTVNQAGQIVADPRALQHLVTEARLAALTREQQVRTHFATTANQPVQQPAPDIAASAPVIVQHFATQLKATDLTPDDRTFLQGMVPRFIRPAVQADVTADPSISLGSPVIDASFSQLVQHQQTLRAQAVATVKTAEDAGKFNAGQKAGTKQPTPQPAPAKTPAVTDPTAKKSRSHAWDEVLHSALSEIGT